MPFKNKIPILFLSLFFLLEINGQPFNCDGSIFFSVALGGTKLYRFDTQTLDFDLFANQQPGANGMGYNPVDNYIYMFYGDDKIIRVDADGNFFPIGQISGLELGNLWAADFSPQGEFCTNRTFSQGLPY